MGDCSTNCNPCGPSYDAINQLAVQTKSYARQALSAVTTVEEFQSLYLGAKATAPTTDNEGNPLQVGALYFNTTDGQMYVWAGSAWEFFGQSGFYLGPKASDPTTDNEGNPLVAGLLYFNTVSNTMRVYNGTFWQNVSFDEATPFLATGTTEPRNLVTRMADVVNVKDFGADPTGAVNSTDEIQDAIDYAVSISTQNPVILDLNNATYLATDTLNVTTGIKIINGKLIFNGSNAYLRIQGSGTIRFFIENVTFERDQTSPYCEYGLVHGTRIFNSSINSCRFLGGGTGTTSPSRYGLYLGDGEPCWGTTISNSRFYECECGLRIGSISDQTHNHVVNCTIDHNKVAGAIICNPNGGSFQNNSVEQNESPTGLAITSRTNGSVHNANAYTVSNNYFLFNALNIDNTRRSTGAVISAGYDIDETSGWDASHGNFGIISSLQVYTGPHIVYNLINGYQDTIVKLFGERTNLNSNSISKSSGGNPGAGIVSVKGPDYRFQGEIGNNRSAGGLGFQFFDLTNGLEITSNVYIDPVSGNDSNSGSLTSPVQTFDVAYKKVSDNGTIISNVGDVDIPLNFETKKSKKVTLLADTGSFTYGALNVITDSTIVLSSANGGKHKRKYFDGIKILDGGSVIVEDDSILDSIYGGSSNGRWFLVSPAANLHIGTLNDYTNTGGAVNPRFVQPSKIAFISISEQTSPNALSGISFIVSNAALFINSYDVNGSVFTSGNSQALPFSNARAVEIVGSGKIVFN